MTDAPLPAPDYDDKPPRAGLSLVWLMPLAAVVIAAVVVWQAYNDRGPLIRITFPSAQGIEVQQTALRFRDVQVGVVESISFADDLSGVDVDVRIDKKIAPYVDESAQFWQIEPSVSARGVSGLDTVLSGVYIVGTWDTDPQGLVRDHRGLEQAPLRLPSEQGTEVLLRTRDGRQLEAGAPILFNGIQVGRVGKPRLAETGSVITIPAFISAPHDKRLTTATRFYDSSGFSVSLGTGGVALNVGSLAALLEGGLSFSTMVSGGRPIETGHMFTVYRSEDVARATVFGGGEGPVFPAAILLDSQVEGLAPGADVVFEGITVGEVVDLSGYRDDLDRSQIQLLVSMEIDANRLGLTDDDGDGAFQNALDDLVANGLRARVATVGLLGQQLVIELVKLADAAPDAMVLADGALPILPTVASETSATRASVEGVFERVNNLPFEELLDEAIGVMANVNRLLASEDVRALPGAARGVLQGAEGLVTQGDVPATLADLRVVAADLRALTQEVRTSAGVASVLTALERTDAITADVARASEGLPQVMDDLRQVLADLRALPLKAAGADAASALARVDALLADDALAGLGGSAARSLADLEAAVADARAMVSDLRAGESIGRLNAALLRSEEIANGLATATGRLPQISEDVAAIVSDVRALPLSTLVGDAGAVVQRIDSVMGSDDVAALAPAARGALTDLRDILAQITANDTVGALTQTLDQTRSLTARLDASTQQVPQIVDDVATLTARAREVPIDRLVTDAADVAARLDTLLSAPGVENIPSSLASALDALRLSLDELREGGAVASLNRTLGSADAASRQVESVTRELPGLVDRLDALVAQASGALSAYGGGSRFNTDLNLTLREVKEAARAARSLARTLERNPQSLLTGR